QLHAPSMHRGHTDGWASVRYTREPSVMLTEEEPVARSTVPFASAANVLITQLDGKPLTSIGGPKKQLASPVQAPGAPPQSASLVHGTVWSFTQCLVASGPREQSRGPVPKLAVRFMPSDELRMVVAFSGMIEAWIEEFPPPM